VLPGAVEAIASSTADACVMHMQGTPATMQADPRYDDVVAEVSAYLRERARALEAAGVAHERIVIDPGFQGSERRSRTTWRFSGRSGDLLDGLSVLVGLSRKKSIGDITGRPVGERVPGALPRAPRGPEWSELGARARCQGNSRRHQGMAGIGRGRSDEPQVLRDRRDSRARRDANRSRRNSCFRLA
jgi:hypothetical protein